MLSVVFPSLRHLKYTLPFIALLPLLFTKYKIDLDVSRYFKANVKLYIFIILCSFLILVFKRDLSRRFFEESFFILAPLFFAYFISVFYKPEREKKYVGVIFWSISISYLISVQSQIIEILMNPSVFFKAIYNSDIKTESGLCFLFGFFFLYFLMKKEKLHTLWALLFSILSFKRIALFGLLVCGILYFFFKPLVYKMKENRNLTGVIFVCINSFIISVFYLLMSGSLEALITSMTGTSPNAFFMGRYNLYGEVIDLAGGTSWFGMGLGKTGQVLKDNNFTILNFHSDVFKNFLEFGPVLFCIWIFMFYRLGSLTFEMLIMTIFLNVVFITDNVFIYFEVMFLFYFFSMIYLRRSGTGQNTKENII